MRIAPLPTPPYLPAESTCLFLDVDGTLLDFAPRPEAVQVDPALRGLLSATCECLGGAVALISGRPLADLDALFAPLRLPAAGIHGFERRSADGVLYRPTLEYRTLDEVRTRLTAFVHGQPGLVLEDKGPALALHYRGAPGARTEAQLLLNTLAKGLDPAFELLQGEQVIEIKPVAMNKAIAIEAFLNETPFMGRTPIYIGDDYTDFDGFAAARRNGGLDIAVGGRVTARWNLPDPAAVRHWIGGLAKCHSRT